MSGYRFFAAALAVGLAAGFGLAQQPKGGGPEGRGPVRGGPSAFATLRQKAVMQELRLSEEQVGKIKEAMMAQRDRLLEFIEKGERDKAAALTRERDKTLLKVLTPAQARRLRELVLQVHGLWAMTEPDTVKELKLTEEQTQRLRQLQKETEGRMAKLFEGEAATRTEAQKKLAEYHVAANEKGLTFLTEAQRATWKELSGAPFKGEILRVPPGGGRSPPPR